MFIVILIFSFFYQINASDVPIISVENFLEEYTRRFHNKELLNQDFELKPLLDLELELISSNHFVTIQMRKFSEAGRQLSDEDFVRTFKVYDPNHVLMKNHDFTLNSIKKQLTVDDINVTRLKEGTRAAGAYEYDGGKVFFKQWPEAAAFEIWVRRLYCVFTSRHEDIPIPASEVILMNGQLFLVSEFMEGASFKGILDSIRANNLLASGYKFNLARFQILILLCAITLPEDCRPPNIFIRKIKGSTEYEFVLIDNEKSLGRAYTTDGAINTRVHCSLFCFHEMLRVNISGDIRKRVASKEFLQDMLEAIKGLHETDRYQRVLAKTASYQNALKQYHVISAVKALATQAQGDYKHNAPILGIPNIKEDVLEDISRRIEKLSEFCRREDEVNLEGIITAINPKIAATYKFDSSLAMQTQQTDLIKVLERISDKDIDGRRYEGPTPASAYAENKDYFGIKTPCQTGRNTPIPFTVASTAGLPQTVNISMLPTAAPAIVLPSSNPTIEFLVGSLQEVINRWETDQLKKRNFEIVPNIDLTSVSTSMSFGLTAGSNARPTRRQVVFHGMGSVSTASSSSSPNPRSGVHGISPTLTANDEPSPSPYPVVHTPTTSHSPSPSPYSVPTASHHSRPSHSSVVHTLTTSHNSNPSPYSVPTASPDLSPNTSLSSLSTPSPDFSPSSSLSAPSTASSSSSTSSSSGVHDMSAPSTANNSPSPSSSFGVHDMSPTLIASSGPSTMPGRFSNDFSTTSSVNIARSSLPVITEQPDDEQPDEEQPDNEGVSASGPFGFCLEHLCGICCSICSCFFYC